MAVDINSVINIAKHAGDKILMPSWGKVSREVKDDGSPVTVVDKQASNYVIEALRGLTPDIPVISEEATEAENIQALNSPLRWVIDPLDGTATYLKGPDKGEDAGFGVHIGLIDQGKPILGVVYLPAQKRMYYTGNDGQAYAQIGNEEPIEIRAPQMLRNSEIRVTVPGNIKKRPETVNGHNYEAVTVTGGAKPCIVAHNEADLMWQDRPDKQQPLEERDVFSHWDLAASHAILKAAGGNAYEIVTGKEVTYDHPSFHVPPCVAGHPNVLKQIGFTPAGNGQNHNHDECAP